MPGGLAVEKVKPLVQFFFGKGGVGKSTTSAIAAVHLARNFRDTLLVSMDPAHNQRDISQQDLLACLKAKEELAYIFNAVPDYIANIDNHFRSFICQC